MRLLFINRFFHPDQSATAQMLTDLAEGLAVSGTAVTVLTGRLGYLGGETAVPSEEQYKGVTVRRVWSTRFGRQSALGRLFDYLSFYLSSVWAAVQTRDVDCVVVLSDPPILSVQAVLLGRLKGWKTVCWLQDVFPEIAVRADTLREGLRARLLRWAANWSLRSSDRVIVVGRCMERCLLAFGLQRDRLVLIPNWADGDHLTPVAPEDNWFRKQHGLEGQIVVMYSGNLGVVHETEALIPLIHYLRGIREVCFLFVGEGQGKTRLQNWASQEKLESVRFLRYQNKEHLRYSLSAGDIHLVTLRSKMEGLSVPSKVYGIMAVGRPVVFIGPDGSEVASLVRESGCGEVFSPQESEKAALAILHLVQDYRRRENLGSAGRRYFESFLDKRCAIQRFQTVFQDMMAET
ncbi:MAG: glycosyltransferase family 4 protein [Nitrospirae bacterium]|nr:MAG: glycosyltransferase family 4 protein [Nitrospirota bacterium]